MSDAIEVMARAIVEAKGEAADSIVSRFNGSWMPKGPLWKIEGLDVAQATLEALTASGYVIMPMEPTQAMIHDGVNALSKLSRWATSKQVANVYRAMIDVEE